MACNADTDCEADNTCQDHACVPAMDGYAVARALREIAALDGTPIVAVTSFAMVGDREKALAAGCDGYLEKPIDPATFVADILAFTRAAPPSA